MLRLSVKPPSGKAYSVPIAALPVRIGRSSSSDLRLEDPFASRLHAELGFDGDAYVVSDLGSGNGTYVNGRRIGSQASLAPGDRLQIGNTVISIEPAGEAADGSGEAPAGGVEEAASGDFIAHPQTTRRGRTGATAQLPRIESLVAAVREAAGDSGEFRALAHRDRLFTAISKVGAALLTPADLGEVLNQILDLIFEAVAAERAYLLLREADGRLVCKLASYRRGTSGGAGREARISRSIIDEVVGAGQPVLTSNAQEDERFRNRHSIVFGRVRSVMAAPLAIEDRVLGMIYVDSAGAANAFSEDDLRMLSTIAGVAAIKVENAVLLEERLETERLRQQLASAREIQARLLPRTPPAVEGYEVAGSSLPSGEVGGDYFDYIERGGGRWLLALGDVSGKGLDAALLMSSLHASIRAQAATGAALGELVERVNGFLHANSPENRFVTLFCAELDPGDHQLRYVNAGHHPPLVMRLGGEVEALAAGGLPLGIEGAPSHLSGAVTLGPGDVLLVYSDGISEAVNGAGEEFTAERLTDLLRRYRGAVAGEILELVGQELGAFVGTAAQGDDRTLIVVRRAA
jgi:phosphoserine phosphatase RsbU/P